MVRVLSRSFLEGPNIHADRSVLVVRAQADFADLPPHEEAQDRCRAAFAKQPSLATVLDDAFAGLSASQNLVTLAPAIASRLLQPWLIQPAVGCVDENDDKTSTFIVPAEEERGSWSCLQIGLGVVVGLATPAGFPDLLRDRLAQQFDTLSRALRARHLDQLGRALVRRARALDIPARVMRAGQPVVRYGHGRHGRTSAETLVEPAGFFPGEISRNKALTQTVLREHGVPVLPSSLVTSADMAVDAANRIGAAVVTKPVDRGKGLGISLDLRSEDQVRAGFRMAAEYSREVMVERFAEGADHRLLVIDGKLIAAARREAATVTGDGSRTVAELVADLNADPRRGEPYEKLMDRVPVDARLDSLLARQGLGLNSIPEEGRVVTLTLAANISQGGTAVDVTDAVHPDNREAVERAARIIGLEIGGVDFLCPDISKSWREAGGAVLELNSPPGLRPHWIADPERDVVTPLVRHMFPEGTGRMPVVTIMGSAPVIAQEIARIARHAGFAPGVSTRAGVVSDSYRVSSEASATGHAARMLLLDLTIDFGVFEIEPSSLARDGMVIEDTEVLIALRGEGEGPEDRVAAQQVAAGCTRGALIVEADDPAASQLTERASAATCVLVSAQGREAIPPEHLAAGGACAFVRAGKIVLEDSSGEQRIDMPLHGRVAARELLIAAAAARHAGIAADSIALALAQEG